MKDYSSYSLWLDGMPGELTPRPALPGPLEADVAVVGAGMTGLWAAYYLKKADPALNVVMLEREIAGFGGSGRNGGWCSNFFAASHDRIARLYGRDAAIAQQLAMNETVDEVGRVVADEGIDARYHKGGCFVVAVSPPQLARVREGVEEEHSWGFDRVRLLGAEEAAERVRVAGLLGASYDPDCASCDPARLTRGLAEVVEKLGVTIYEQTPVTDIGPGVAETAFGAVKAKSVIRTTESYTVQLPGHSRDLVPIYSLMIATEPLPTSFWDEVGWSGHETFTDGRQLIIYAMRTDDDRIAIGGRGAPYHFNSQISDEFDREPRVFGLLHTTLKKLFPSIGDARITHHWGGPVAAPRDWFSSVHYNPTTGLGSAGGYVGDGVSTTNLAGRTLADLVRGVDSDIARLPWVGHRSKRWEPEPLRWIGVNLSLSMMGSADNHEEKTGRSSKRAELVSKLITS
jgi:glycine/D-amino acid oxidase-like deaminating enzyme